MTDRKTFNRGDRVAYSAGFLRSTCQHDRGHWRGTVVETQALPGAPQLVSIRWDHGRVASQYHDDGIGRVIAPNLTLESRIGIDAAKADGTHR